MSDIDSGVSQGDIAIVGMALRVPGARTVAEFWRNLVDGVESIETRTPDELLAAGESAENLRRKNYVPRSADLPGLEDFDADFFGFSPKEAAIMDPQHRQFLECAWEALEDSTRPPASVNGPVGVFAGCGMGSYFYFNVLSHRALVDKVGMFLLRHTGNDKDFLATRASYLFDLHGPSVNVQTACSTSLVAVHQACQSLISGECEMALAGGVTIELPHGRGYLYQDGEILSTDGHCRAFDHRASGTVFGSGVGVVVLRRLQDALADGDPIHAVIKATAVNNDGASKAGYLAPSVTGQAEAIIEAQTLAGVDADTIGYVECHGTGTYLGDPIEIEALTQAFRQTTGKRGFCRVGSVKSNIGHLDTAAGVTSLIKAVLTVKHGQIPPTLGFEKANPAIPFDTSPFVVADRLTPWPAGRTPRRAAVNSLGVGGTNAHAIIEEPPQLSSTDARTDAGPQLIVLTARSRKALDESGLRIARHLEDHPHVLIQDAAHTLLDGRRHFEQRRVFCAENRADALRLLSDPDKHRVFTHTPVEGEAEAVFLFPGGGAQYPHMARALYRDEPSFRATVDEGLGYLAPDAAAEIRAIWLAEGAPQADAAERFLRPSLQLPAILIVEVALARLWLGWGVKPAALIGHSMGENAAACVAGVLSFERAVKLVRLRGELFEEIPPGGMLSVALAADALKARLPADLDLASVNAPELCVVSGSNTALDAFAALLAEDGIETSRIPIDIAAHSRMLQPILERFEAFLAETPLAAPQIPIVSNLTGAWLAPDEARSAAYWRQHLSSTVRFGDGMALLAGKTSRVFIEVGPGRVLGSLAKAQGIPANQVINSLPHADEAVDDRLHFLTALGRAWATGLKVPVERFSAGAGPRRVHLPPYAFQHDKFFLEQVQTAGSADAEALPVKIPDMENWGWQPVWAQGAPDVRIDAAETPQSWLVFLDGSALGTSLVSTLRGYGHEVATVRLGDAFRVSGPGDYVLCPEQGRDGYDALLKHLADERGLPERIVHLWLVTHDESARPGSSFFHRNLERGFMSLFFLGQALSDADATSPVQISVVTNGMQRVGSETLLYPEKAAVLGPARVLPRELPNVSVRVIDVPMAWSVETGVLSRVRNKLASRLTGTAEIESPEAERLTRLADDLLAANANEIVAYRGNRRWVLGSAPLSLDKTGDGDAAFREGGIYLVTGGLGELALACAEDLARRFKARVVLVARTGLPDRADWPDYLAAYRADDRIGRAIAAIQRMEAAGGEVMAAKADITDSDAMRAAVAEVRERFGPINGVLHAAGIVKDSLIALKDLSDIEEVFAPKIQGTLVLADALRDEPLDLMVLFSSTSTDTAPAGQADYVAANAFLNAFAESRAGKPGRTIAVHWGVWKDVGLAARAIQAAEGTDVSPSVAPAQSALFDRRLSSDHDHWLETRFSTRRHWVLDEHRMASGQAIFPGTGYIELAAEAFSEIGFEGAFEIEDLTFLNPLNVADDATVTARVRLQSERGAYRFTVESDRGAEGAPVLIQHADGAVRRLSSGGSARLDIDGLVADCNVKGSAAAAGDTLASAQSVNLRFGPRWQVLRSTAFGANGAMAKLELGAAFLGDLDDGIRLHPALLDIATGYAMDLIPGYDAAEGLWVPMTYGRIRVYGTLPATVWSYARLSADRDLGAGYAAFDVTVADESGRVLVDIEGFTVKQLGKAVELGAALASAGDAAARKPGASSETELSPALARLAHQVDQGILAEEGFEALLRAVGAGKPQVIVSSMNLEALQRAAARSDAEDAGGGTAFDRPDLGVDFVEPATDVEKTLAGFWSDLLGVKTIGTEDNFFDLGGHSLIAVRLFRLIKAAYAVDFPISVLFEAPTIAQCAALIEEASPNVKASDDARDSSATVTPLDRPRLKHVVRMDGGRNAQGTPFFLVSGMFGNILNLRHLAVQIGADRPVYGLQARGIFGDDAPHDTFEEMARDYIAEIRTVQPHGPYLIGGFSGGGLVAYEMAQQLRAAGEDTALVAMLDTPYPTEISLSVTDRILMKRQDFEREGLAFPINWMRRRIAWEKKRLAARFGGEASKSADQFHNDDVHAAFLKALARYRGARYERPVLLCRPKLEVNYRLTGGRSVNRDWQLVRPDNGWSPLATDLTVIEVPGDHDGMVLEPNVRVLARHLREALVRAENVPSAPPIAAE